MVISGGQSATVAVARVEVIEELVQVVAKRLDYWPFELIGASEAIIDAGSYPPRVAGGYSLGGGPHMGSGLTIDTAAEIFGR